MTLPFSNHQSRNGPLPPKQAIALDFIDKRLSEVGTFPSHIEIRDCMGWKRATSVNDLLYRLAWRGRLRYGKDGEPKWVRVHE